MARDRLFEIMGNAAWIPIIAFVAAQTLFVFYPPLALGQVVTPVVTQIVGAIQAAVLNVVPLGDNAGPDHISVYTVLPVAALMVLFFYVGKLVLKGVVRPLVNSEEDAYKLGECALRGTYYFFMFVTCYSISTKDGYWANSRLCWEAEQTASLETESYYVAELAYYVSGIFIHVFLDQPLKDYWVMFSHHVITILLIYCSYVFGYQRVGMLVLLCHDVSDIFLDYAKCFHYLDLDMLSTLTFVNMLISWVLYRLYYYPTIAINSAMFESIEEGPKPKFHELFCIWLSLLQILHVYWFGLMLDVARRRLFEGEIEDVRDDEAVKRQSSQRKPK